MFLASVPAKSSTIVPLPVPNTSVVKIPSDTGTLNISLVSPSAATIQSVPPLGIYTLFGSLLIAILTLLGVWLTIRSAATRTRLEIGAAAERAANERALAREMASDDRRNAVLEAHQERITNARRTAYLEAADAAIGMQKFIAELPKVDLTKIDIGAGPIPMVAAIAKVSLLGEMNTVLKGREILSMLHLLMFDSFELLLASPQLRDETINAKQDFEKAKAEFMLKLDARKRKTAEDMENAALDADLVQLAKELEMLGDAWQEAEANRLKFTIEYGKTILYRTEDVNQRLDEFIAMARDELGLVTSLPQLQESTAVMQAQAIKAMEKINGVARKLDGEKEN